MTRDYIYFYRDNQGNNIPLATGATNDLQQVLWLSRQEKETIAQKEMASKKIFIRVNGENFVVKSRVNAKRKNNHMKKLINVLWAIEKDLHVIASNTEALNNNALEVSIPKKVSKNNIANPY
ncbi:hypothetical protein [Levilactobacillus brevis]|nr:hypothetical protein [Levilactobacillus brevis]